MRRLFSGLLMVAFLSAPAIAADPAKNKKNDPDKVICRVDRTTGSAISDRICKKRSEWDEEKYQARELLDQRNRMGQDNTRPRGGG